MTAPWFVCPRPLPRPASRLLCFAHAGGGVPLFRNWPDGLGPDVEVWVAHLPGRGSRMKERPFSRLLPLVQALARAWHSLAWKERPFAFFGHSLGARIAFELARSLQRQGQKGPQHLIVSASPGPQLPRREPAIHTLPKETFLAELRRRGSIPDEVWAQPDLLKLLLPVLRADFTVYETAVYHPGPLLECPITAFGGTADPLVALPELQAWQVQTKASFHCQRFPGDHFYLKTAEASLLQAMRKLLVHKGIDGQTVL